MFFDSDQHFCHLASTLFPSLPFPSSMGLPSDTFVHNQFKKRQDGKIECKHCLNYAISQHVGRMRKHLQKCSSVPADIHDKVNRDSKSDRCLSSSSQRSVSAASGSESLDGRFVTINQRTMEQLKILASKFIITSGSPFNIANNEYLKEFFKKLNIPMLFPERHLLSKKFLPIVYEEAKEQINDQLDRE